MGMSLGAQALPCDYYSVEVQELPSSIQLLANAHFQHTEVVFTGLDIPQIPWRLAIQVSAIPELLQQSQGITESSLQIGTIFAIHEQCRPLTEIAMDVYIQDAFLEREEGCKLYLMYSDSWSPYGEEWCEVRGEVLEYLWDERIFKISNPKFGVYCFVVAATGYNVTRIISTLNTLSRAINDHLLHLPFYLHTGEREDRYAFDCLPFSDAQWRDCLFKDNFQCSAIWNPRSEKLIGILSGNVTWEEGLVFLCATRGHAESSLNKQFCTLQVEGGGILDATIEYFRLSDNTQCLVEKKILTNSTIIASTGYLLGNRFWLKFTSLVPVKSTTKKKVDSSDKGGPEDGLVQLLQAVLSVTANAHAIDAGITVQDDHISCELPHDDQKEYGGREGPKNHPDLHGKIMALLLCHMGTGGEDEKRLELATGKIQSSDFGDFRKKSVPSSMKKWRSLMVCLDKDVIL